MNMGISGKAGIRILSLDGGDIRCLSQLVILEEFMGRLEQDTGKSLRPCQYFHHMVGVGAGGVIAILLGVLGMTVETAKEAFARMCNAAFPKKGSNSVKRSRILEQVSKEILEQLHLSEKTLFRGDTRLGSSCKVSICHMSAVNLGLCRMLRSFNSRHASHNPTIIEAMRTAWATPGLFCPVTFGPELMEEDFVSGVNGFNNPALEAIREAHEVYGGSLPVALFLSLGAGKSTILSVDSSDMMQRASQDTENTARRLQKRLGKLNIYFRFSVERGLEAEMSNQTRRLGNVVVQTTAYLQDDSVSTLMDQCLTAANNMGRITLDGLLSIPNSGSKSGLDLPPLSPFYVMRQKPMKAITRGLTGGQNREQRIMVVSALSGSGKTQLAIKFARENDETYDHILFIDASSVETLQNGLIKHVRALDPRSNPATAAEALRILADLHGTTSQRWLLIFDSADDDTVDLRKFFPSCDYGSILITTQNPKLGYMSPDSHLLLDVMTEGEAIEALLATALWPSKSRSTTDVNHARDIVERLGYLPLAIVQAGCYIRMQQCLPDYLSRLEDIDNRDTLLRHAAPPQRDIPKYTSIYAAFDATLNALSLCALHVLSMLSFIHCSDFPRCIVSLAASHKFAHQPFDLLERQKDFPKSIALLKEMFFLNGIWKEHHYDEILEELQQYSVITLVTIHNVVTLRIHPLLHAWAHDRLSDKDRLRYRAAAVRLMTCAANPDNSSVWEFLAPHLRLLSSDSDTIHVNDWAASIAVIHKVDNNTHQLVACWASITKTVKSIHGEEDVRSTRAALELAAAYWAHGESLRGVELARRIVRIRQTKLGKDNPETPAALACLARGLRLTGKLKEARELQETILQAHNTFLSPHYRAFATDIYELALSRLSERRFKEAEVILSEVVDLRTSMLGRSHPETLESIFTLAECHEKQKKLVEAEVLRREALTLREAMHGSNHINTFAATSALAASYCVQGKLVDAEKLYMALVRGTRETLGLTHSDTLDALTCLAEVISAQKRYADAEKYWREVVDERRKVFGQRHRDTLYPLRWLAEVVHRQSRYADAELLWKQVLAGRRALFGNFHEETLDAWGWLAACLDEQGQSLDAERCWREIVERKALLATNQIALLPGCSEQRQSADARVTKARMSILCYQQKSADARYARNSAAHEQAAKALRNTYSASEFHCRTTLGAYGGIIQNERLGSAVGPFWSDFGGKRELLSSSSNKSLDAEGELAEALSKLGRHSEAEALWRKVIRERSALLGDSHSGTLHGMYRLAQGLQIRGEYAEAEFFYKTVVDSRRGTLGTSSKLTLDAISALADVVSKKGRWKEANILYQEAYDCQEHIFGCDPDILDTLKVNSLIQQDGEDMESPNRFHYRMRATGGEHAVTLTPNELAESRPGGDVHSISLTESPHGELRTMNREGLSSGADSTGPLSGLANNRHVQGRRKDVQDPRGEVLFAGSIDWFPFVRQYLRHAFALLAFPWLGRLR